MATVWGILSAGKISHDFVTALRSLENHEVKVVAAKNLDNAKKFAALHKIPVILDNYEDIITQGVDVVYCGSLNTQHYELVKLLLENKIPVLCEKPLTMYAKHTQALVKIARENKVFLMEAIWSRFLPVYDELRKNLPSIGEIQQVNVTFGSKEIKKCERVTKPELGGSSILDIGVYCVNFAQLIFQDEVPVQIQAVGDISSDGVDFQTAMILKYRSGKFASLTTSLTADLPCEAIVHGVNGSIKLANPFWCPESLDVNGRKIHLPFPETLLPCNYVNSSGLRYEAMHVRECLQKGLTESPVLPLDATLKIAEIMEICLKKVGAKQWQ
ncbi:trans-1,2-dihydrobenzene-1,2-diol dehydrogenase isoform X2 [Galendromus occidentalis]|nr:trans-1,2-dihydrobenzene-1,2-diol dehydrogenase isoform X2 [Galendromus occidentalis]